MFDELYNEAKELFGDMRDVTQEEADQVAEYINSISEPTGINFWEKLDEFVGRRV